MESPSEGKPISLSRSVIVIRTGLGAELIENQQPEICIWAQGEQYYGDLKNKLS